MHITVIFALADEQTVLELRLADGATVAAALDASTVRKLHPEIDLTTQRVGIWGRPVSLATPLRDGDRVEIYRPLQVDPRQARRRRQAGIGVAVRKS